MATPLFSLHCQNLLLKEPFFPKAVKPRRWALSKNSLKETMKALRRTLSESQRESPLFSVKSPKNKIPKEALHSSPLALKRKF